MCNNLNKSTSKVFAIDYLKWNLAREMWHIDHENESPSLSKKSLSAKNILLTKFLDDPLRVPFFFGSKADL